MSNLEARLDEVEELLLKASKSMVKLSKSHLRLTELVIDQQRRIKELEKETSKMVYANGNNH